MSQSLFPNFRLHRVRRIASVESALVIVGHRFEPAIPVSRFGQTSGVQQQEVLGAENLPLDYVNQFVEVQGFIFGVGTPKEVGVPVRDSSGRLTLEVGKLPQSKRRKRRHGQTVAEDDAGGIQESFRKVMWQTRKVE